MREQLKSIERIEERTYTLKHGVVQRTLCRVEFHDTVKVFAVVTTTPTLNVITLRRTSWILRPRCSHFVNNRANRARYCESLLWFTTMGSFIVANIGLSTMLTWHISDDIQWCNKKINCCQKTFFYG